MLARVYQLCKNAIFSSFLPILHISESLFELPGFRNGTTVGGGNVDANAVGSDESWGTGSVDLVNTGFLSGACGEATTVEFKGTDGALAGLRSVDER